MQDIPQVALKSIPLVLFLMLVSIGFLGFLAMPGVGNMLGPWVCEAGETMIDVQTPYSRPGESGVSVEYFCETPDGERKSVGFLDMVKPALMFYAAFFLFVVWPLITFIRVRRVSRIARFQRDGIPATARIISVEQTSTRINEKPVMKIALEIEQDGRPNLTKNVRKAIPQLLIPRLQPGNTMPALVDPLDRTKVLLDFDKLANDVGAQGEGFGESDDELDALRALKQMYDEGLIDFDEFEAKKAEIMDRM